MFDNEISVNEAMIRLFNKVASDIPEEELFYPGAGHGHPPVWVLGHLAIAAEMGQRMLGGMITHKEWLATFGIGSSDIIAPNDSLNKNALMTAVVENYQQLRNLAGAADADFVSRPHNVELFAGSPIQSVGHLVSHLLTSHFGFHVAQLSSCRRTAGFGPLF